MDSQPKPILDAPNPSKSPFPLIILLLSWSYSNTAVRPDASALQAINKRFSKLILSSNTSGKPEVGEIMLNLPLDSLFQSLQGQILDSIAASDLTEENVEITSQGFSDSEEALADNVPFQFAMRNGRLKAIVSPRIKDRTASRFFFYIYFLKAYARLDPGFFEEASPVALGTCALLAQSQTYTHSLAILPRFMEEAAFMSMVSSFEPNLIPSLLAKQLKYEEGVQAVKGILTDSLGMPPNKAEAFLKTKGSSVMGPFDLQALFESISMEKGQEVMAQIDQKLGHLTLRFLLHNAFAEAWSGSKGGEATGSSVERKALVAAFKKEMALRYSDLGKARTNIRFEPNSYAALFLFLFNTSPALRASKVDPVALSALVGDSLEKIKDTLMDTLSKDPDLQWMLEFLGTPRVIQWKKVGAGSVLGLQWKVARKVPGQKYLDSELVQVEFRGRKASANRDSAGRPVPAGIGNKEGDHGGGKRKGKATGPISLGSDGGDGLSSASIPVETSPAPKSGAGDSDRQGGGQDTLRTVSPTPGKDFLDLNDLRNLKPPSGWDETTIPISKPNGPTWNLAFDPACLAGKLDKSVNYSKLFLAGISETPGTKGRLVEADSKNQVAAMLAYSRGVYEAYENQRKRFWDTASNLRTLHHILQMFTFLYTLSLQSGCQENARNLERDFLEMALRSIFANDGMKRFYDLHTDLAPALKFVASARFFLDNPQRHGFSEMAIPIRKELHALVKQNLDSLNGKRAKVEGLAVGDILPTPDSINLRNLVSQLAKWPARPKAEDPGVRNLSLAPCRCEDPQMSQCLFLADDWARGLKELPLDLAIACFNITPAIIAPLAKAK
jgi:hypothetical protein